MASGSFALTRTGGSTYITYRCDWVSTSNGVENNTSDVKVTVVATKSSSSTAATYGKTTTEVTVGDKTNTITDSSWYIKPGSKYTVFSYTFTNIPHNSDGTKSVTITADIGGNSVSASGSATIQLDDIPRYATIVSATNFDDTSNPTMTFSNPAGSAAVLEACISLNGSSVDIPYVKIDSTSSSYTFSLTEQQHDILREATVNDTVRDVYLCLRTTINGVQYYEVLKRTYTVTDCNPVMNPTITKTNPEYLALTNDPTAIIQNANSIQVTFGAYAQKKATITKTRAAFGYTVLPLMGTIADSVLFSNVSAGPLKIYVTDSRNLTVYKEIDVNIIPYTKLTCNGTVSTSLDENNNAKAIIKVNGDFYNQTFGSADGAATNALTLEYQYDTGSTQSTTWQTLTPSVDTQTSKYSALATIDLPDYTQTYTFRVRAKDLINTNGVYTKDQVVKIVPSFDWGPNDFRFNIPLHAAGGVTYDTQLVGQSQAIDLNDITVSGTFFIGTLASNRPTGVSDGWLKTQSYYNAYGLFCYQTYTSYSGEKFERLCNAGTWSVWTRLTPKVLWSGALHMSSDDSVSLAEAIDRQNSGINLIFSEYDTATNTPYDDNYVTHFVSKIFIAQSNGNTKGMVFSLSNVGMSSIGGKYLKISSTKINGDDKNMDYAAINGVVYDNAKWVLRYVIGI